MKRNSRLYESLWHPIVLTVCMAMACGGNVDVEDVAGTGGAGGTGAAGAAGGTGGSGGSGGDTGSGGQEALPGTCSEAQPIVLDGGSVTIESDTTGIMDEYPELDCNSFQTSTGFNQGQLYYRFMAKAGATYTFQLQPSFYGFVYAFPRSIGCSQEAIQDACSSGGETGMVSGIVNPGKMGKSWLTAAEEQEYVVAVDGDTSTGPFTLVVTES